MTSTPPRITHDGSDCPHTLDELNEFLDLEDFDREHESLRFAFRAECEDRCYWVWSYMGADGHQSCAVITKLQSDDPHPLAGLCVGCGAFDSPVEDEPALVEELLDKGV